MPPIRPPARLWQWAGWVCLLCVFTANAESLRVAAWNLRTENGGIATDQASFLEGAAIVRELNPDVILLQGLKDRDVCLKLTEALKPAGYSLALCSSFGGGQAASPTDTAKLDDLKRTTEARLNVARNDLLSAQRTLGERQGAVGPLGKQLLAQGAIDWPDVPPEKMTEYTEIARESDKLKNQDRELVRRGYKDTHPLVQTVRTMLRNYSTERAELERDFPALKFLGGTGDLSTNLAAQATIVQLQDIRKLRAQATTAGITLSNIEFEASRIAAAEARMAEAAATLLEQQKSGAFPSEVAIVSRLPVELKGADSWSTEAQDNARGGLVFATVKTGQARAVFISATWAGPWLLTNAMSRLQRKLDDFKAHQETASTVVISLTGNENPGEAGGSQPRINSRMEQLGFMDCLRDLPSSDRGRRGSPAGLVDGLFVGPVGFALRPQLACDPKREHCISVCEIELDQSKTLAALPSLGPTSSAQKPGREPGENSILAGNRLYWVAGGVAFVGVVVIITFRRRRQRRPRQLKPAAELGAGSAYTMVLAPKRSTDQEGTAGDTGLPQRIENLPVTTQTQSASWQHRALEAERAAEQAHALLRRGLLPDLSRWLKQKLVHKLLTDRADLVSAHQAAARQVAAVDQRLARIEAQMQVQNRAYVRRIEELTKELNAAKEENRGLIQARIAQVKSEMQAAREKLLKEGSESTDRE